MRGKEERWELRGKRRLRFDNGREESVYAIAVPHETGEMWERIWIKRDDGTFARQIFPLSLLLDDEMVEAVRSACGTTTEWAERALQAAHKAIEEAGR